MLKWPDKDPDELLDYEVDWSARLAGDTIATSAWIVPDGIVKDPGLGDSKTDTSSTIWLSGGALGESYTLTNRINTGGGRIMDQSVILKIRSK